MSLTRKMLQAMSIEEEKIDQIIEAHTSTVNALKEQRDEYKEGAAKLEKVQKELDELKKQSENGDDLQAKYDQLKKEYDDYKANQTAAAEKQAKETAYRDLLIDCGVSEKRLASIIKVADLSKIKLDKEGKIDNADAVKESVKTEWADFIVTTEQKGAKIDTPPVSSTNTMTKEDILKIKDTSERQRAIAANLNLFQKG